MNNDASSLKRNVSDEVEMKYWKNEQISREKANYTFHIVTSRPCERENINNDVKIAF